MLTKLILTAAASVAVLAMGAPSASALWRDNGIQITPGSNPSINITGTAAFTSPNGGTHEARADLVIQLTGGTTTSHFLGWLTTVPSEAEVSGGLVFLTGGTTSLKSASLTSGGTAHSNGSDLTVTGIALHYEYNNGFKITLSSKVGNPLTMTLNNRKQASQFTLTGSLGSGLGDVSMTGHFTDHSPTYGIEA